MKKLSIFIACLAAGISAHGATVNWSAQTDTGFASSNGAALAQGNYIRLGYFNFNSNLASNNAQVAAFANPTLSNVATLNSNFVQFGTAQVGDAFNFDGFFQAGSAFSYFANPSFDLTKQVYMWVIKASNNGTLGSALGSVTEQAIFYAPKTSNAEWAFPASENAFATSPDIGHAKPSLGGVILAGSYQASNTFLTSINGGNPTGAIQLQGVTAVPEPSTFLAGIFALFAAAGARRRRSE